MYTTAQINAIVFIPIGTGFVSFVASGALIVMILFFSRIKLSAACRRIIFGLCVYDIFLSLSSTVSTAPIPVNQGLYGASGNIATCDAQGFFLQMGSTGSILYNASLSVYYVSVIKFNMKEKAFRRKVELWCHLIPNAFAICTSIFLQTHNYFNSIGTMCWISAYPVTCLTNPDIPCIRGNKEAIVYQKWLGLFLIPVGFVVITINMLLIISTVLTQKRKSDKWRFGMSSSTAGDNDEHRCRLFQNMRRRFHWFCDCWKKDESQTKGKEEKAHTLILHHGVAAGGDLEAPLSIKACLKPVEMLNAPTFHKEFVRTSSCPMPVLRGDCDAISAGVLKAKTAASRSATKEDRYAFNISKVRSSIRRESILNANQETSKLRAPASRSGTANDPYPFNLRSSFRRESTGTCAASTSTDFDLKTAIISLREEAAETPAPTNESDQDNEGPVEEEVIIQALLYISAFVITRIFPLIGRTVELTGNPIPFSISFLMCIFMPLQGFFNICVYTRPHVKSIRRNNPDYSLFKAFWIAFKAGGDNDSVGQTQGSTSTPISDATKKRRQDRIRKDFQRRMSAIERRNSMSDGYYVPTRNSSSRRVPPGTDSAVLAVSSEHGNDIGNRSVARYDEGLGSSNNAQ